MTNFKPEIFTTTIEKIEYLSIDIVKLILKTQNGKKINYEAGQYAKIEIPDSGKFQPYAISNMGNTDAMEFIIRILGDGSMSSFLRDKAAVGDNINVDAPHGDFYLRPIERPVLFFAGGTGISPLLAMLDVLDKVRNLNHPIKLFYGASTDDQLVELKRLEAYKKHLPFVYKTCTVEKSALHPQGFVTQWLTKEYLVEDSYDAYVCGPNSMVEAVKSTMAEQEIVLKNLYLPY